MDSTQFLSLILTPGFVWISCFLVAALAVAWAVGLVWQHASTTSQVLSGEAVFSSLKDKRQFLQELSEVSAKLAQLKVLASSWRMFLQGLVTREYAKDPGKKSWEKEKEAAMATRLPEECFTPSSLLGKEASSGVRKFSFYILGFSFFLAGLILVAYSFMFRSGFFSLELLEGGHAGMGVEAALSLAAWVLLNGVFWAIALQILEQFVMTRLAQSLSRFNFSLSKKIDAVGTCNLTQQQSAQIHEQTLLLRDIESFFREQPQREKVNEEFVQALVDGFLESCEKVFSRDIDRFADALAKVTKDLHQSTERISDTCERVSTINQDMTDRFSAAVGSGLADFSLAFDAVGKTIADQVCSTVDHFQNSIEVSQNSLYQNLKELQDTSDKTQGQLATTVDLVHKISLDSHKHGLEVSKSQQELSASITPLLQTAKQVACATQHTQSLQKDMRDSSLIVAQVVRDLQQNNEQMSETWKSYCLRFEGIDKTMNQSFVEANRSMVLYTERFRDLARDMDKQMSKGLLSLAGAVSDLRQSFQGFGLETKLPSKSDADNAF